MKRIPSFVLYILIGAIVLLFGCGTEMPKEESSIGSSVAESEATSSTPQEESDITETEDERENPYMKAVWLSQYDLSPIYVSDGVQRSAEAYTALIDTVLDHVKNDGYNTVIVQLRPFGDSMYPSEVYPVSSYVGGAYGNKLVYDPMEILMECATEKGLAVHGWINPLRAMKAEELSAVDDTYLLKQWFADHEKNGDYLVEVSGRLYLNPAHSEVRELIVEGAKEICQKYHVAGIHMDDYFYPTTDASFDQIAYDAYKKAGGTKSLTQFRYENINALVRELYSGIKSVNEELQFGISPMGNLETSYTTLYTDVYTWCKEDGYIDYICPQIYFGLEHQTHDFKSVYRTWKAIIKNENVELYVGMTLGKAQSGVDNYAGTGKTEWADHKDVLKRCLEYLQTKEECTGVVFFCYQYMYDPVTGASVAETATERKNMKDALDALGSN